MMSNICTTGIQREWRKIKGSITEEIIKIFRDNRHKFLDTSNSATLQMNSEPHYHYSFTVLEESRTILDDSRGRKEVPSQVLAVRPD